MYQYWAKVIEVYDGDTITVDIDLGLGVWKHGEKIRLFGLNAPEMRGVDAVAGKKARDYLRELVLNKDVVIDTYKDGKCKYGRYLAKVSVTDRLLCVNEMMIESCNAVRAEY